MDIELLLKENSEYTERLISDALSADRIGGGKLAEAMRYSALGGGKRIRAFLVRYFCRAFGGRDEASAAFCRAIELVHAYSLIHDDLPCMDNDDMRRGKPSCHKAFGEAEALLAGDTLLTYAFECCASNGEVEASSALNATSELARCAGALGMCGGQQADIYGSFSSFGELADMQDKKTGALMRAAALLGCYAAGIEPNSKEAKAASKYASSIGLAFQITDDILDATADETEFGKPVGSDEKNGKSTALTFMSIGEAEAKARLLTDEAIGAVAEYDCDGVLAALAEALCSRKK